MKRAITFLIALFASTAFINAQDCEFTFTAGNNPGEFIFMGPVNDFSPNDFTFWWSIDGMIAYSQGQSVNYTYTQTMLDSVVLNIYNSDSMLVCSSAEAVFVFLNDTISGDCMIYAENEVNSFNSFVFSVDANPSNDVVWTISDAPNIEFIGNILPYTFAQTGQYDVCVNIYEGQSIICSNCITINAFIDSSIFEPSCNALFWTSTSALTGYFVPEGYYFNDNYNYSWSFGDGATSTEEYPYHIYNQEGSYEVCLTVTDEDGLCTDTYCENVYIPGDNVFLPDSLCFSDFVITQEGMFEVIVVNGASGNELDFTWTLEGEGISITSSGAFPTIEVETTGAFLFCLTVSDGANCSATYCDSLIVDDNGIIGGKVSAAGFTINVVSPMQITDFPTSIETAQETEFTVYPNPFETHLFIQTDSNDDFNYEIYSVDGRLIKNGIIQGDNQTINTSDLKSGIYLLNLINGNGTRSIQKILKK